MSVSSAISIDPPILTSGEKLALNTISIPTTFYQSSSTIYTTTTILDAGTYLLTGQVLVSSGISNLSFDASLEVVVPNPTTTYIVNKTWSNNATNGSFIDNDTLNLTCVLDIPTSTTITINVLGTPNPVTPSGISIQGTIDILTIN
jgi:hypothetical protein|nr:MAG: hypothetical protein [Lake Baikal virophage 10]